jgi:diguanylate cyclase (GGDEF)-like protein
MDMLSPSNVNQVQYLMILCFSFLIFVFQLTFHTGNHLTGLLGTLFFIPFYFCIASVTLLKGVDTGVMLVLAEVSLLIFISLGLSCRLNHKKVIILRLLAIIFPIGISMLLFGLETEGHLLYSIGAPLGGALSFLNGILSYKKHKDRCLFRGFMLMCLGFVFSLGKEIQIVHILMLLSKFAGYLNFYMYFSRKAHQRWMGRVKKAERDKAELEATVQGQVEKQLFMMRLSNEKLLHASKEDGLTKAYNKAAILEVLEHMIATKQAPFTILMFDIDHFKKINDTYGHVTGDQCIKSLAQIAKNHLRRVDYLGRYGGDEFIIILPGIPVEGAKVVAERLREQVSTACSPRITISMGIAVYDQDGTTVTELISKADQGLYRSKRRGRNAVSYGEI